MALLGFADEIDGGRQFILVEFRAPQAVDDRSGPERMELQPKCRHARERHFGQPHLKAALPTKRDGTGALRFIAKTRCT